jgi:hypothetical protein
MTLQGFVIMIAVERRMKVDGGLTVVVVRRHRTQVGRMSLDRRVSDCVCAGRTAMLYLPLIVVLVDDR